MNNFKGLDHVLIAAPKGCETEARKFFKDILGLEELEKPKPLKSRGGVWFKIGQHQLHIGVESDFIPAQKAHPAFEVCDLNLVIKNLEHHQIKFQQDDKLEGAKRIFCNDPFRNRLEILEWI